MAKPELSIVVPLHNEEENIYELESNVQGMFKKYGIKGEIILVDDNSTDSTPEICDRLSKKANVSVIHRSGNPGMGYALKEGTSNAGAPIVAWVMGDLTDDMNTIPKFIEIINKGCDMVFGSRYMKGGSANISFLKKIASNGFTLLGRIFFGIKVHDITNAFRAFRKEVFDSIELESGDFAISPEFAIKAHLKKFKLCEVSTSYKDRTRGVTKFRMLKMARRYFYVFLKCLVRH